MIKLNTFIPPPIQGWTQTDKNVQTRWNRMIQNEMITSM